MQLFFVNLLMLNFMVMLEVSAILLLLINIKEETPSNVIREFKR